MSPRRMDKLKVLESMGLVLPTPAYLGGAILFGIIGSMIYLRGRKNARPILTWTGVALMFYPYAVPQTWLLWTIGSGLCCWAFLKWD